LTSRGLKGLCWILSHLAGHIGFGDHQLDLLADRAALVLALLAQARASSRRCACGRRSRRRSVFFAYDLAVSEWRAALLLPRARCRAIPRGKALVEARGAAVELHSVRGSARKLAIVADDDPAPSAATLSGLGAIRLLRSRWLVKQCDRMMSGSGRREVRLGRARRGAAGEARGITRRRSGRCSGRHGRIVAAFEAAPRYIRAWSCSCGRVRFLQQIREWWRRLAGEALHIGVRSSAAILSSVDTGYRTADRASCRRKDQPSAPRAADVPR
jgi:hypothetical protein